MLAGSLTEFGLADVFSLLATTRKTGVLNLEGAESRGRVWIAEGGLCHAVSDVRRAPLAARLLHGREATAPQAEALISAQAEGDAAGIADALAAVGLSPERAKSLVIDQVTDAVFDLSRWGNGTFAFDNREANGATPVTSAVDVLASVQQRLDEWDAVLSRVPAGTTVLELVSRPRDGAEGVNVMAPHWEVLTLVDGLRSIAEVIEITGQGTFVVSRLLADLVDAGLVAEVTVPSTQTASERRHRVITGAEHQLLGAAEGIVPGERPVRVAPPEPTEDDVAGDTPDRHAAVDDTPYAAEPETANDHDLAADDATADASDSIDPRSLLSESYGSSIQDTGDGNPWNRARTNGASYDDPEPTQEPTREPVSADVPEETPSASELLGEPSSSDEQPAPTATDSADQRRARELAALGIAPAPTGEPAVEEPAAPLQRDSNVNADLLARLISGVKGA